MTGLGARVVRERPDMLRAGHTADRTWRGPVPADEHVDPRRANKESAYSSARSCKNIAFKTTSMPFHLDENNSTKPLALLIQQWKDDVEMCHALQSVAGLLLLLTARLLVVHQRELIMSSARWGQCQSRRFCLESAGQICKAPSSESTGNGEQKE